MGGRRYKGGSGWGLTFEELEDSRKPAATPLWNSAHCVMSAGLSMWSRPTVEFLGGTRPLKLSGGMKRGEVGKGWAVDRVNIPLHSAHQCGFTPSTHAHACMQTFQQAGPWSAGR